MQEFIAKISFVYYSGKWSVNYADERFYSLVCVICAQASKADEAEWTITGDAANSRASCSDNAKHYFK